MPHAAPLPLNPVVERTRLPRAGLEVSRIGLGLANMHLLPDDVRRRLLHRALDLGITHFDTSRFYSDGLSEIAVGKFLRDNRRAITIATKFGLLPTPLIASSGPAAPALRKARSLLNRLRLVDYPRRSYARTSMRRALADSLRALKSGYIDIYFLHEPLPDSRIDDGLFEDLQAARSRGDIRLIGVAGITIAPVVERFGDSLDVIQTGESAWTDGGLVPDITYSLFSGLPRGPSGWLSPGVLRDRLRTALARRPDGAVLVQARTCQQLEELVSFATTG